MQKETLEPTEKKTDKDLVIQKVCEVVSLVSGRPVNDAVRDQIVKEVTELFKACKDVKFVWPYLQGSMDVAYFSYYDYFAQHTDILPDDLKQRLKVYSDTHKLGAAYLFPTFCVVSQKPTRIMKNELGLHCEGGPAVTYGPNLKIWALNGVIVPQYLAETPAGQLDIEFFKNEGNAEVRTEFIRKYGVERMLHLGRLVDSHINYKNKPWWKKSGYELWDMQSIFPDTIPYAPHLKMVNQTTGVFHVEACSPDCRTIPDALKERFNGRDLEIEGIA